MTLSYSDIYTKYISKEKFSKSYKGTDNVLLGINLILDNYPEEINIYSSGIDILTELILSNDTEFNKEYETIVNKIVDLKTGKINLILESDLYIKSILDKDREYLNVFNVLNFDNGREKLDYFCYSKSVGISVIYDKMSVTISNDIERINILDDIFNYIINNESNKI